MEGYIFIDYDTFMANYDWANFDDGIEEGWSEDGEIFGFWCLDADGNGTPDFIDNGNPGPSLRGSEESAGG